MHINNLLKISLLLVAAFLYSCSKNETSSQLQQELQTIIDGKDATIGIALIANDTDTLSINNDIEYPLMSVMKMHQAIHVAKWLQEHDLDIYHMVNIPPEDLKPDTYSPLRDSFPNGNIKLTVKHLLEYTLKLSDNNACDILFKLTGGPHATDSCIRSIGMTDFLITATEDDMHRDISKSYANHSTPLSAASLINDLFTKTDDTNRNIQFIRQTMLDCNTGLARIPKGIGAEAKIAHKTGTGDRNSQGRWIGTNDVAYIMLPDGSHYSLAVFVKDSFETPETNEAIIAEISSTIYQYLITQPRD